ncbi:hypothetical protein GCK72_020805 [Caenorhabditis remanei]|uniref:Uncharacterized protein n=1 Tax=Caenorhabditis remanei TaxID=31234 RepID=A0A6A5GI65_CAERE|nr:hypothetical protein GCK72_020805 [Caenorhabditis remanei]KAF1754245.1 hypothetical protein GCK72_020805 [Caenorhabditis remanei]
MEVVVLSLGYNVDSELPEDVELRFGSTVTGKADVVGFPCRDVVGCSDTAEVKVVDKFSWFFVEPPPDVSTDDAVDSEVCLLGVPELSDAPVDVREALDECENLDVGVTSRTLLVVSSGDIVGCEFPSAVTGNPEVDSAVVRVSTATLLAETAEGIVGAELQGYSEDVGFPCEKVEIFEYSGEVPELIVVWKTACSQDQKVLEKVIMPPILQTWPMIRFCFFLRIEYSHKFS